MTRLTITVETHDQQVAAEIEQMLWNLRDLIHCIDHLEIHNWTSEITESDAA